MEFNSGLKGLNEVRSKSPSTYTGHVLQIILGILKQTFCFF